MGDVLELEMCIRDRSSGENYYELGGRLTIHGVTKDVSLDLVFNGVVTDTWGKRRLGVTATTELCRDCLLYTSRCV